MTPEEDFVAFAVARQRSLLRSAWLLTGDTGLAEDLVQTALVKAWRHWPRVMATGGTDAYVRRVIVTTHSSFWRRRWRGEVPTDALPDGAAAEVDREVRETVRRALLALPPRQRAVVVLRYFDDLSEQQTAEALGCSVGTVKSQAARGLARLRDDPALAGVLTEGASA